MADDNTIIEGTVKFRDGKKVIMIDITNSNWSLIDSTIRFYCQEFLVPYRVGLRNVNVNYLNFLTHNDIALLY